MPDLPPPMLTGRPSATTEMFMADEPPKPRPPVSEFEPTEEERRDAGLEEPAEEGTQSILDRSKKLRFPRITRSMSPQEKIGLVQQHIVDTAIMRGELAELRLSAHVQLQDAADQWDALTPHRATKSMADRDRARAELNPTLAKSLRGAKWLIDRCSEEIERMDADYEAASRYYTTLG